MKPTTWAQAVVYVSGLALVGYLAHLGLVTGAIVAAAVPALVLWFTPQPRRKDRPYE